MFRTNTILVLKNKEALGKTKHRWEGKITVYFFKFQALVTVHHERRLKREKPTRCN